MGNWRQKRRVSLYEQPVKRNRRSDTACIIRILIGDGTSEAQIETGGQGSFSNSIVSAEGMQYPRMFAQGLRQRGSPAFEDGDEITAGFTVVNDDRQAQASGELKLPFKGRALERRGACIPVIIKADLTYGDYLRMAADALDGSKLLRGIGSAAVWMNADRGKNCCELLSQPNDVTACLEINARINDARDTLLCRALNHLAAIIVERGEI
jgi:hypothetical protein